METFNAIILGIIQGITEFLPISSSGHLEIFNAILGRKEDQNILMTVVLHFATALSTIIVFRKDISEITSGLKKFENNASFKFSLKIILSMIPAALVGILLKDEIEMLFVGNLMLVGSMLLITGLLLLLADRAKSTKKDVSKKEALIIGVSQAFALLPGISRAGATISTSVLLGVDKEKSAKFSFLMVIPLIFGMMGKTICDGEIKIADESFMPLLFGFLAALLTGMIACKWMIKLVKNSQLKYFSYYCFIIGVSVLIFEQFL